MSSHRASSNTRDLRTGIVVALLILLGSTSAVSPADARGGSGKTERIAEGSYRAPWLGLAAGCTQTNALGCIEMESRRGERFIQATVRDEAGQAVFVQVSKGDNEATVYGNFCGASAEPIQVPPRTVLHFWIGEPTGLAGCNGVPTTGLLTVTFSDRR